jgi:glycogen(starch) synthase
VPRPLRILFLSIEYPPETPDGIGSYVAEIGPALVRRGHEVHVLSCLRGQARRDYEEEGVWIHRRGEARLRGLTRVIRGRRTAERLRHALACWREARSLAPHFDVIETPDWMAEGLLFALARRPLIAQLHTPLEVTSRYGTSPNARDVRAASRLERLTVERARLVISPSALLVDLLRRSGWLRKTEPRIVRFPIQGERWHSELAAEGTPPTVFYAGRLEPLKAPEVLVDAAALLSERVQGVEVLLAGRSSARREGLPYGAWLEARIASRGAPCRLLGQVPREEIRHLCALSRVFAIPSRYENLPFAALEAMSLGRPVVCTSNNGLAELLMGSGAGAVVKPGDAEALAGALEPYLSDRQVAGRAGKAARELVRTLCAPERIAEQREEYYLQVAGAS